MGNSKMISTDNAPAAVGPYCQARRAGGMVFLSGQIGLDPATGEMVAGGATDQARQALANLGAVLDAAGLGPVNVVKATVFLTDMADFAAVNEIYAEFFAGSEFLPARACVAVAALPKAALVEVEAVALVE